LEIETVVPDDLQIHEQKRQLIKLSMKVQQIEQGTNAKFAQVQSEQDNMRQELSDVKVRVNSLEKKSYSRKFTDMMIMTEFSASVSNNSRSCPSSYLCRGPNGKITD
jgi:tRNA U34 5-carboxymethylaminomethyl modifying enzyme MnmG/GidA